MLKIKKKIWQKSYTQNTSVGREEIQFNTI